MASYDSFIDRELDRHNEEQEAAEHEQEELDALIERVIAKAGNRGFESLGVAISRYCGYDGGFILQVLSAALTDSNFHTLNNEIDATVKRWREGD
jgi:hypothetical protein